MNSFPSCEPSDGETAKLNILVIATQNTALAARMSMALSDVEFRVATLTPRGHPVRQLRKVQDHFAYRPGPKWRSALRAIQRWSPDLLVCTDDLAVTKLHILHQRMSTSTDEAHRHISKLIELSLGPAASFPTTCSKSNFLTRAAIEGLRCPKTIVFPATRTFESIPVELTCPIAVKADQSYGGLCVRIADSEAAVRAAVWELQTPGTWHGRLRRIFGSILASKALAPFTLPLRRTVSLQQYIPGRPGNRAVICWKGDVLAGLSVEATEVTSEHGPASVVRLIDHPGMAKISEHMVRCLNLSGFVGFDFVLDSSNEAWVIEMNPRVTPICHLSLINGTNLPRSLYRQMKGLQPLPVPASADRDLIALFPNEIMRCPSSEYIQSARHDVPWNEPNLVNYLLAQELGTESRKLVRTFVKRFLRRAAGRQSLLRFDDLPQSAAPKSGAT